jgi:peptidyl-prolyl cis-trans isomerase D
VFSLEIGEYSNPIQSDLGWHVFIVKSEEQEQVQEFADVREKIVEQLKAEQGAQLFYDFISQIEDDIASGVTLDALAKKYDLKVEQVKEVTTSTKTLPSLPEVSVFTALAFEMPQGELSNLTVLADGQHHVVLVVDNVQAKRTQALDEVRGRVVGAWKEQQKASLLQNLANELAGKIKEGAEIARVASVPGLSFLPQRTIPRALDASQSNYTESFVKELFLLKPSEMCLAFRV